MTLPTYPSERIDQYHYTLLIKVYFGIMMGYDDHTYKQRIKVIPIKIYNSRYNKIDDLMILRNS